MARGQTTAETPVTFGGKEFRATMVSQPVEKLRKIMRNNIHKTTRILKKRMVQIIKQRHAEGEPGTGYTKSYAMKKTFMTGRPYTAGQSYDYEWSGQLHGAMEGRGRAKPSKGIINTWVGFRRNKRRAIKRSPGADPNKVRTPTNRQLTEWLNTYHSPPGRPAFHLHEDEREKLLGLVAKELTNS